MMMNYDPERTNPVMIGEMNLEKFKIQITKAITKECAQDFIHSEVYDEIFSDQFFVQMVRDIMAFKLKEEIVKYPENWKEAVKERFFSDWMKRRWPIKFKIWDAYIVFPELLRERKLAPESFPSKHWYYTFKDGSD